MSQTIVSPPHVTRKRFSTPALLFGSIIAGLGLAGIVATIGDAGWDAGLAVGMILGGTTTVIGLLYRYRATPSVRMSSPGVSSPGASSPEPSVVADVSVVEPADEASDER